MSGFARGEADDSAKFKLGYDDLDGMR